MAEDEARLIPDDANPDEVEAPLLSSNASNQIDNEVNEHPRSTSSAPPSHTGFNDDVSTLEAAPARHVILANADGAVLTGPPAAWPPPSLKKTRRYFYAGFGFMVLCILAIIVARMALMSAGISIDATGNPPPTPPDNSQTLVRTSTGLLQGLSQVSAGSTIYEFLGVPFAAPPVGALRWMPPEPAASWTGIRNATQYSPACFQDGMNADMSEDCLYLNVFTPTTKPMTPLPVMVWIYGGSFIHGSAGDPAFHGANIVNVAKTMCAKAQAIVVTINYRVGALGFLALESLAMENPLQTTGLYGMMDQQAGLKWVKANIGAFGGDVNRVTIFGESAGSMSVCLHLVMEGSWGLFSNAIMESGACTYPDMWRSREQGIAHGVVAAASIGCGDNPTTCLRAKPASEIVQMVQVPASPFNPLRLDWGPLIDGRVLKQHPATLFKVGKFATATNILTGTNKDEGTIFIYFKDEYTSLNQTQYVALLAAMFRQNAPAVAARYPMANYGGASQVALSQILTDAYFMCETRYMVQTMRPWQTMFSSAAYLYEFRTVPSWLQGALRALGSYHSAEVSFVFGNPPAPFTASEQTLSNRMIGYWSAFATSSTPTSCATAPTWPLYEEATNNTNIVLDATISLNQNWKAELCNFWDSVRRDV